MVTFLLVFLFNTIFAQVSPNCHCVFKEGTPTDAKQARLDYACGQIDCSEILPGGKFFVPDTVSSHAAWAIDEYFQNQTRGGCGDSKEHCDFSGQTQILCQTCSCVVAKDLSTQRYNDLIKRVCDLEILALNGTKNSTLCASINPGGSNFQPDTPYAHAVYLVAEWFRLHFWDKESCIFPGYTQGSTSLEPEICDDYMN